MRTSLCFSLMSYGGSYDFFRPFDKEIVSSECKKLNGRIYVNLKPRTYDCRVHIRVVKIPRGIQIHLDILRRGGAGEPAALILWPLYFDNLGPEGPQPAGGPWPGSHPAKIHHANTVKRSGERHAILLLV